MDLCMVLQMALIEQLGGLCKALFGANIVLTFNGDPPEKRHGHGLALRPAQAAAVPKSVFDAVLCLPELTCKKAALASEYGEDGQIHKGAPLTGHGACQLEVLFGLVDPTCIHADDTQSEQILAEIADAARYQVDIIGFLESRFSSIVISLGDFEMSQVRHRHSRSSILTQSTLCRDCGLEKSPGLFEPAHSPIRESEVALHHGLVKNIADFDCATQPLFILSDRFLALSQFFIAESQVIASSYLEGVLVVLECDLQDRLCELLSGRDISLVAIDSTQRDLRLIEQGTGADLTRPIDDLPGLLTGPIQTSQASEKIGSTEQDPSPGGLGQLGFIEHTVHPAQGLTFRPGFGPQDPQTNQKIAGVL
jgi:hypothetical protein